MMIIGITGSYCAGKDSIAMELINLGFYHFSLSDVIRQELIKKNVPLSRSNLIEEGDNLRMKHGAEILAKKAMEKCSSKKDAVLTSIRNLKEVEFLKELGIPVIYVDAPAKLRFERMKRRNRKGDPKTFEEFLKREKEEDTTVEHKMNMSKVKENCSLVLMNNGDFDSIMKEFKQRMFG